MNENCTFCKNPSTAHAAIRSDSCRWMAKRFTHPTRRFTVICLFATAADQMSGVSSPRISTQPANYEASMGRRCKKTVGRFEGNHEAA